MSETLKYLNNDNWGAENAAQQFMESRLAKNKYTINQQEELMRNGGPAVVNASEGVVPEGGAYDKYGPLKGEKGKGGGEAEAPASDDGSFALTKEYGTLEELGFSNEDIQSLIKHVNSAGSDTNAYGFTSDTEHHFKELDDATAEGSIEAKMRKIGKHMGYEHAGTLNQQRVKDYINEWRAKKTEKPAGDEEGRPAIEHSPEIKQAKERVRAYEDGVMSGRTSDSIFGSSEPSKADYSLDLNKGAAGIGTPRSGDNVASKAAGKFLESKTADVKNKYQFEAK